MSQAFKSFERFYTSIRMFWQMSVRIIAALIVLHIILTISLVKPLQNRYFGGERGLCIIMTYYKSFVVSGISFGKKCVTWSCGNRGEVDFPYMENNYSHFMQKVHKNLLLLFTNCCWIYLLFPLILLYFSYKNKSETEDQTIRGKDIISPKELKKLLNDNSRKFYGYRFKISGTISIPESIVNRHTFIIGKSGSGKSQLIYKVIEQIIKNEFKCIIHDFKGDMISSFYDPQKHLIFNPLDQRHVNWNLFSELKTSIDIDAFVSSLIPDSASNDNFWPISSRQLLGAIITYCLKNGHSDYKNLWKYVNISSDELLPLLQSTEGCEEGVKLLTEGKTANNIMAVLSNYTRPIKYLIGTDGTFSIKEWVKDNNTDKRVIFISNMAMIQDTIRPFIALFVDFATKALCSLNDDLNRRLYFILDELGQIGKVGSIIQLLTQSRSKGGAAWLLIQDVAQVNAIYGKDGCTSIVNSCGNTISLSVKDAETAEFVSKNLGSIEIKRTEESMSMGVSDLRDSISQSSRIMEKRIVLPAQLTTLPDLELYMQLVGMPVTKDRIKAKSYKENQRNFTVRDEFQVLESNSEDSESIIELIDRIEPISNQLYEKLNHETGLKEELEAYTDSDLNEFETIEGELTFQVDPY